MRTIVHRLFLALRAVLEVSAVVPGVPRMIAYGYLPYK